MGFYSLRDYSKRGGKWEKCSGTALFLFTSSIASDLELWLADQRFEAISEIFTVPSRHLHQPSLSNLSLALSLVLSKNSE